MKDWKESIHKMTNAAISATKEQLTEKQTSLKLVF